MKPTYDEMGIAENAMLADGFDDCLVGSDHHGRAVYDAAAIIRQLETEFAEHADDEIHALELAVEYAEYNIFGAYWGDMTPLYIYMGNDGNYG